MIRTILLLLLATVLACKEQPTNQQIEVIDLKVTIASLNNQLVAAAKARDFTQVDKLYLNDAILLAEYNPLIAGKEDIEKYYAEIFKRQEVTDYQKETTELFDFGATILEIGDFKKSFSNTQQQEGKYFNVWQQSASGSLKLKSEAFGYYHPIDSPASLR
ncbi:nuclear transport factor 2 family protein, partial [Fulvivirga sp.]|uniref:YybH family protein n=1 Tax=Fulvivirga sp. TaxID=1931237 RepID=UPI0032EAA85F